MTNRKRYLSNEKLRIYKEYLESIGKEFYTTTTSKYRISDELYNKLFLGDLKTEGIRKAANITEIDNKIIKHGWLKTKQASVFFTNPEYETIEFDVNCIDWDFILSDIKIESKEKEKEIIDNGIFDRFVYTDTHVGMNPNPDGYSLYGGRWDETELMDRLAQLVEHIIKNKNSKILVIDDLGDFADGYDGKTVRREHDLPQNMDNQKMFDVGVKFKFQMFKMLEKHYEKIIFNNICRSNHSASFDYIINSCFKNMINLISPEVEINNYRKFINYYQIQDNIFIITHGKDDVALKTGFKPHLQGEDLNKINDFIDNNFLQKRDCRIEFSKGDSHQLLLDWSSSDRFDYFNYPSIAPASSWVQTNFKKSISGCILFNYKSTFDYEIKPLFFKWKE